LLEKSSFNKDRFIVHQESGGAMLLISQTQGRLSYIPLHQHTIIIKPPFKITTPKAVAPAAHLRMGRALPTSSPITDDLILEGPSACQQLNAHAVLHVPSLEEYTQADAQGASSKGHHTWRTLPLN